MVKKPLTKLVDKKSGKVVDPKKIMPIIFTGLRRSYKYKLICKYNLSRKKITNNQ